MDFGFLGSAITWLLDFPFKICRHKKEKKKKQRDLLFQVKELLDEINERWTISSAKRHRPIPEIMGELPRKAIELQDFKKTTETGEELQKYAEKNRGQFSIATKDVKIFQRNLEEWISRIDDMIKELN
jgi:hypothetical protein